MSSVRHDENNGAENVTGCAKDTCDMHVSVGEPHPAAYSLTISVTMSTSARLPFATH